MDKKRHMLSACSLEIRPTLLCGVVTVLLLEAEEERLSEIGECVSKIEETQTPNSNTILSETLYLLNPTEDIY